MGTFRIPFAIWQRKIKIRRILAQVIKGKSQDAREFPSLGPRPLFFWVGCYDEPWHTPAAC